MRVIGSKRVLLLLMCSRRFEEGHESDESSAGTLVGGGSPEGEGRPGS